MTKKLIIFICEKCGNKHQINIYLWNNRKCFSGVKVCNKCAFKLNRFKKLFDLVPEKYHKEILQQFQINFSVARKYLRNFSTKIDLKCDCIKCSKSYITRFDKIFKRKYFNGQQICPICLPKLISNSQTHKLNNSEAQLIAQNKPDRLFKNQNKARLLWKDNNYKRKCLVGFSKHNQKMQTDPAYANKHKRRSKSVSGIIKINNYNIRFDSMYEVIFLWYVKDEYKVIRRCEFAIVYGNHFYHPDFFLIGKNGERVIIEVKGFYKNKILEKKKAAEEYILKTNIADSYEIYDTDRLIREGILIGVGSGRLWKQIKEIYNAGVITFTDSKHKQIAEIGRRRFIKLQKNQNNKTCSVSR